MKRRPPPELSDYWEIFLRRVWWVVIPALLISGGTIAVVSKLPKIYRSETLILVEPQKVPADFVRPTVSTDVNDRLQIISQEILSRTRLQQIIDQFGLYRDQPRVDKLLNTLQHSGKPTQEDIIEEMRKDIAVEVVADEQDREHTMGAFKISYQGYDPALVQRVTREIASLFISENVRVREMQAEGTTHFIDDELEKARLALDDQERRLSDFKARHMGSLPEQQTANLQLLGQLQTSLQVNAEALARAQEQKTYLQSMLGAVTQRATDPLKPLVQSELDARREELRLAEQRYSPQYPEVIRLKGEVSALEKLSQQGSKGPAKASAAPPTGDLAAQQIRGQIAALDDEVKRRTREQAGVEKQIKQMQARVEALPAVEQQMSELDRDYEISKLNYGSLLEKKNASAMAGEMERRAEGEQFRVLDPASYPEKPYKPDVTELSSLGILGGILCGCGLGLLMEFKDKSIRSSKDAAFYLRLPSLASLPLLNHATREKSGSRRRYGANTTLGLDLDIQPTGKAPTTLLVEATAAGDERQPPQALTLRSMPERLVAAHDRLDRQVDEYAKEQFRAIRTRLVELMRVRPIRSVMITSAMQGEGKTWVSANLAFSMSCLPGLRVLLVDADLRGAGLANFFKVIPQAGLSTYLLNGKNLGDVCLQVTPNLSVVLTRRFEEGSAESLSGKRMREFLDEALRDHDLVIIDTPPVLMLTDAQVVTALVDAAILVVRAGESPYDLAREATQLLKSKIVGTVVNGVRRLPAKNYYGYYHKNRKSQ